MIRKRLTTLLATLLCLCACTTAAWSQVAVIAHPSVPEDALRKAKLLDVYTGDVTTWSDGTHVVVFDLKKKNTVKDTFYAYIETPSSRMKTIWLKRKLMGEGSPPKAFATEEEMLTSVASTPGSIGFISKAKVGDGVKILVEITEDATQ